MRPLFADPKTDFVFRKIFGSEEHKDLLIALLNDLLELPVSQQIATVALLPPEQRPPVEGMKNSILDVKCRDAKGIEYVVEMQILYVEGFAKRIVYNGAKAYINQLNGEQDYPALNDVIGVTICDFELWPGSRAPEIPMLSRWRMQEQHGGAAGIAHIQFVFLELPKYTAGTNPQTMIDKWAYFFREAGNLAMVPEVLAERPFVEALEAARAARFTEEEWDAYIRAGMAIQDERGAITYAKKEGMREGKLEGKLEGIRLSLRRVLEKRQLSLDPSEAARIEACSDLPTLERWLDQALSASTTDDALR
jgi:predicted transposase/invertase (TIGR01784 family)